MEEFLNSVEEYRHYLIVVTIIIGAFVLNVFLRSFLNRFLRDSTKFLKVDKTRFSFFKNAVSLIVFSGALGLIIYSVPTLRKFSLTLFASAGIFAAILGFASQHAFANIISGIFIVIFKPFRVGDWIDIKNKMYEGIVEDITLRHVVINNFENKRIIIPNSIISTETIINSNIEDKRTCEFCEYRITYSSDLDRAIEIVKEEAHQHPNLIDWRTQKEIEKGEPLVHVRAIRWDEYGIVLRAYLWAEDPIKGVLMRFDLNATVKKRFDQEERVTIGIPHRHVVLEQPGGQS